ncbi:alpha-amylase family glycosyl hydrolase [Roseburia hominis]
MKTSVGYPLPQGCTLTGKTANFSIAVPEGKTCELLLYRRGHEAPSDRFLMEEDPVAGNLRHIAVALERPERYEYGYLIEGRSGKDVYCRELGQVKSEEVGDGKGHEEYRYRIASDTFDWEGDAPLRIPPHEVVAYSIHVRGFTKHASSRVKKKGTFAGIMEKLPYLQELGINQLHCMPVYEFDDNLRYKNYWGYGEGYFFAPKRAYASGDAVSEMKELVKTLHKAGIELVIEMPFTGETPLGRMIDCLRFWVLEYHVDGFLINPALLSPGNLKNDPVLARTKLLYKDDYFQNTMRRFLKGDEGMVQEVIWQLRCLGSAEGRFNYITSQNGFTLRDLVSYDGKHNEANGENNQDGPVYNYSWNCGAEGPSRKSAVQKLRLRQSRNAYMLLLLAQGMPCLLAGDEFGNTQKGNNNVYCQDNPTAWLDFGRLPKEKELHDFVRDLIRFRKEHSLLHPVREMSGMDQTSCGVPDVSYHGESAWRAQTEVASRQLGVFYHDTAKGEENLFVAYNMHWLPHSFALPTLHGGLQWHVCVSTDEGVLKETLPVTSRRAIELPPRTIMVLKGK